MIKYKKLDTEYDSVVIFDMLSENERKKDKISEELESFLKDNQCPVDLLKLSSKRELFDKLDELKNNSKQGKKYMFHFVSHGNEQCIGFKHTKELIQWKELEDILKEINSNSENTLVLNMTTCFGNHGIKTVNPFSDDKAFFGLIGYSGKLKKEIGKKANKQFYKLMIDGKPINEAIKVIQSDFSDNNFNCITSQGYSEFEKRKNKN